MQNAIVRNDGLYETTDFRSDGWYNILSGMGTTGYDKRLNTQVGLAQRFDRQTLTELYRGDGLGTRIIDIPVKDMIREWFVIEGDPEGDIVQKMSDLSTQTIIKEALIWARVFGGSIVIMLIDDGKDLEEPVEEKQIRSVVGLQVYDRYDIDWSNVDLYNDEQHPKFGLPEIYNISNVSTGKRFKVHDTRILRFEGELVPKLIQYENQGWGDSTFVRVYDRLRGLGDTYAGVEGIITEFIIGKLTIKNLQALIGSKEGTQLVKDRLQILDMSKHMLNTLLLDEKEEFDRVSVSGAQGLSKLVEKLEIVISAISGIPFIKLFPEQTKGLGGEAQGNIRMYYDDIASDQKEKMQPQLKILSRYIQLSKDGPFNGMELENWDIKFNKLWQPTAKEEAETRETQAKTDELYFGMGLPGEIIVLNRFGGESYSSETVLPDKYVESVRKVSEESDAESEEDEPPGTKKPGEQDVEPGIGE